MVLLSGWLILLKAVFSIFIHVVACIRIPFLFMAEYYSTVGPDLIVFTHHPLMDIGLFSLSTKNKAKQQQQKTHNLKVENYVLFRDFTEHYSLGR